MLFWKHRAKQISQNEQVQSTASFVIEVVKVVVISLAIILPVRYFLIQPFYVKGASMEPNFENHEYLIIDEISYRFNEPERGQIVVFRPPTGVNDFYIKRVVGLPGETVTVENGDVIITSDAYPQGIILDESMYLASTVYTGGSAEVTLGEDEYFVMGDNRSSSLDSRRFGAVSGDSIIGRAWLRGWPVSKITIFESPEYNL